MTFGYVDMLGMLAREHQRELIEAAAERRMVRLAREAHPSARRRHRSSQPPDAA